MIRFAIFAALTVFTIGVASDALAAGSCRPTRDGKDRMEMSGGCPSGYVVRGACCESVRPISQPTGAHTCPAGTILRLGACVPRQ
jgi:sensor domain CHASE-containing protein